jgi:hypothetical protein
VSEPSAVCLYYYFVHAYASAGALFLPLVCLLTEVVSCSTARAFFFPPVERGGSDTFERLRFFEALENEYLRAFVFLSFSFLLVANIQSLPIYRCLSCIIQPYFPTSLSPGNCRSTCRTRNFWNSSTCSGIRWGGGPS